MKIEVRSVEQADEILDEGAKNDCPVTCDFCRAARVYLSTAPSLRLEKEREAILASRPETD